MLTILYNRVIMLIIVACIVPHAINGLRLILLDLRVGEGNQRVAAWMALSVAVAILIVVGWMILW
jgi:succinate dehydrogenase/fumarate reductase cytochrome b subunit